MSSKQSKTTAAEKSPAVEKTQAAPAAAKTQAAQAPAPEKTQDFLADAAPTSTAVEEPTPTVRSTHVLVGLNRAQGVVFKLPDGRKVEVAGNAVHLRGAEIGTLPVGAFGLTSVKREDWEWIEKTYAGTALFKSGRIFAADTRADALAEASEKRGTRHGLEPAASKQTRQEAAD